MGVIVVLCVQRHKMSVEGLSESLPPSAGRSSALKVA